MSQLEFLGEVAPADTANTAIERIRAKSAEVMLALFRLVKTALLHSAENAALRDTAAQSARILDAFAKEIGGQISLSFLSDTMFVCGQLLRAPRGVYESAAELGALLAKVGISELTFEPGTTPQRMLELGSEIVNAIRAAEDSPGQEIILQVQTPGVEGRQIDPQLLQRRAGDHLAPAEQILRLYATALVALRQFYEDIAAGGTTLPHRLKRIAQKLVILAEREDPAMLGMTTLAKSHRDDAGRAVQTAILALAMTRQITKDRVVLAQIVLSALVLDSGRARMRGRIGDRFLSDKEEAYVVPASAFACIATGGVNPANARRTSLVTETAWLERTQFLGAVWGAELQASFASGILLIARGVLERIAPRDGGRPAAPIDAVQAVLSTSGVDPVLGKLLVRALGVIPPGTVVELSNGAWALVLGPSERGAHASLVRVMTDARGQELNSPKTLDLGLDRSVAIDKIVDQAQVSFNATRTFTDPT